jgi:transglycosylase-like protein with SLT domain
LSSSRTVIRIGKPSRFILALAGSAVAVAAVASGATALAAGSGGQRAAVHAAALPAGPAGPARPAGRGTPSAPGGQAGPASLVSASGKGRIVLLAYTVARSPSAARRIARAMLPAFGWAAQFRYLDRLWQRESGWNCYASNPSGAYGIPQALPGSKMASAGPNWRSNPATQIRWGLRYIRGRYGSPRRAWNHEVAYGWY